MPLGLMKHAPFSIQLNSNGGIMGNPSIFVPNSPKPSSQGQTMTLTHKHLTMLKENLEWFTVIDLKDAFICIPLSCDNQELFTFEWENLQTGRKTKLTWTVLPQGFKNRPTIFGNQLAKELEEWKTFNLQGALLQYVDDILIATKTKEQCQGLTVELLNFLGLNGYRVLREKVQVMKKTDLSGF